MSMNIEKISPEEFEKERKEMFFNTIQAISNRLVMKIDIEKIIHSIFGRSSLNIPNVSISVNNKVVELSNLFKKAGISMFYSVSGKYNNVNSSYIGNVILSDLMNKLFEATDMLNLYSKKIEEICNSKVDKAKSNQNQAINKFVSKLTGNNGTVPSKDIQFTDEENEALDKILEGYKEIESWIWNYNLEDNLVPSLVKTITEPYVENGYEFAHKYASYNVPAVLENCIIPDLKKLGLEHLIPELEEALIREYEKDLTDHIPDEIRYLLVPDFTALHKKLEENNNDFFVTDEEIKDTSKSK